MGRRGGYVFSSRKRRHWGAWVLLILVGLIVACAIYTVIDGGRIIVKTQRVLVADLPKGLEGFTVLQISDLNGRRFGPAQKQLSNALKGKRYSAVCITGDMVGSRGDPSPFYELLAALDTTKPVYFIPGDADPTPVGTQPEGFYTVLAEWVRGGQTRGATFLGAPASLSTGGATVWFTDAQQLSLDLDHAANAYATSDSAISAYYNDVIAQTKAARAQMKEDDLHIALSHKPVSAEMIHTMQSAKDADGRSFVRTVDLLLAGGSVGGQWRLPFVGPVWSGTWFPGDAMAEGYHYTGGLLEYITAGLGTDVDNPLPDFRLFNTPEVVLITFTSQMDDDVLP